jgi:hypothetical protein
LLSLVISSSNLKPNLGIINAGHPCPIDDTKSSSSRISYPLNSDGFDHINRNAPVLIRTPKLTRFEPAQYWGGGPPGNSVVLNPFFFSTDMYRRLRIESRDLFNSLTCSLLIHNSEEVSKNKIRPGLGLELGTGFETRNLQNKFSKSAIAEISTDMYTFRYRAVRELLISLTCFLLILAVAKVVWTYMCWGVFRA